MRAPKAHLIPLWVLWLIAPVLLLVLSIALLSLSPGAARLPGEPLIVFGALLPFAGGVPIFRLAVSPIGKVLIFSLYYCACAVAMFVAGWAALGAFGLAA